MKLAQALIERADLQRQLQQLNQRMLQNAQYQEGETPSEQPIELLNQYRQIASRLQQLIVAINLHNSQIQLPNGMSMTAALAERERLKAEHATLIKLADAATPEQSRYSRSEIKMLAAVNVKQLRQQADQIAKQARELDLLIQEINWLSEMD